MAVALGGHARRGLIGVDHLEHIGGRDRYIERMLSHQRQLANAKPLLSREPPATPFEGGTRGTPRPRAPPTHQPDAFAEVREAWRRIIVAKPAVDSNLRAAARGGLARELSRNRRCGFRRQQLEREHATELYHQRRRIEHQRTSLTERKKNKLDASLYPSLLMRTAPAESAAKLAAEASRRAAASPPPRAASSAALRRPASARAAPPRAASAERRRPASARAPPRSPPPREEKARARAPRGGGGGMKPLERNASVIVLRRRLLEEIVDRRIFKASDLKPFLQQVARENAHVDAQRLHDAIRDVEREFYLV